MRAWILLAGFILCNQHVLRSQSANFSVTVTSPGQALEHSFKDPAAKTDKGSVVINLPTESKTTHLEEDVLGSQCFYVVLHNVSPKAIRLDATEADWFDCLSFQVTSEKGKVFSIHRPADQVWYKNSIVSWGFEPDGIRVICIDFTTGSWEGFPSEAELPRDRPFKIQATFELRDIAGVKQSSKSSEMGAVQADD